MLTVTAGVGATAGAGDGGGGGGGSGSGGGSGWSGSGVGLRGATPPRPRLASPSGTSRVGSSGGRRVPLHTQDCVLPD